MSDPLVRIDDHVLSSRQALAMLDLTEGAGPPLDRLVEIVRIEAELCRDPVPVGDEELQRAFDDLRLRRGLHGVAETERWLATRGLTMADLERCAAHVAGAVALRDQVATGRIEGHFQARAREYDVATVAWVEVPDHQPRSLLHALVATRTLEEATLAWMGHGGSPWTMGPVRRGTLSESMAAAIFELPAGQLRQVREPGSNWFVHTFAACPARLDGPTRELIAGQLLEAFLDERWGQSTLAWSWSGDADWGATGSDERAL